MGQGYKHFSLEERCELARRREAGQSIRQIAAALDRAPSSVSRELKRNPAAQDVYKPVYASQQAQSRRWRGSRLERNEELQDLVLDRLARGWSPQQVSGRLTREQGARASAMRASIASSPPRSHAPRITAGATICRAASPNAGSEAAGAAQRPNTSRTASPSHGVPLPLPTAKSPATGKAT